MAVKGLDVRLSGEVHFRQNEQLVQKSRGWCWLGMFRQLQGSLCGWSGVRNGESGRRWGQGLDYEDFSQDSWRRVQKEP